MSSGSQNKRRQTKKTNSQNERALQYYELVSPDKSTYKCIAENCNKILNGRKSSNLVTHLRSIHSKLYEDFVAVIDMKHYELKRLKFIQNCSEIIAINGRPFTALNDSGFRKIVEKDLDELRKHNCGINMDDEHFTEIKDYIESVATKIKNKIIMETKDKLLSIMVDIARKNDRSFLGINVQYTMNGAVELKLLGMIELKEAHTALYIKQVITCCLMLYGISIDQIVSITTDNGANMLAMINLFNADVNDNDDASGALEEVNPNYENENNSTVNENIETASVSSIDNG